MSRIGILDSGLGGLTVAAAVCERFPDADIIYLGDTARVPYGTRTPDTIRMFAFELLEYFSRQDVRALIVACNTVSATCIDELRAAAPFPVIDVIAPTVEAALASGARDIAVLGTRATIRSGIYGRLLSGRGLRVREIACPLFVPIVEEGFASSALAESVVREHLAELLDDAPEAVILGCTHYPYLAESIRRVLPSSTIIDSSHPTAASLPADIGRGSGTRELRFTEAPRNLEALLPHALRDAAVRAVRLAT